MATLVGFTANKLILNSSNFRREMVGLERINDVYTARTQDAETFGNIIKNGASHKTVTGYLSPLPTLANRHEDMLVENVESTNEAGDITTFNVTYVGLFRDLKPKPLISLAPVDTFAFNPFSITIEFVTRLGAVGSQAELDFLKTFKRFAPLPSTINAYPMPRSQVAPFNTSADRILEILRQSDFFRGAAQQSAIINSRVATFGRGADIVYRKGSDGFEFEVAYQDNQPLVVYRGFGITGISYTRYGNFALVILSGADSAYYSYFSAAGFNSDQLNYF